MHDVTPVALQRVAKAALDRPESAMLKPSGLTLLRVSLLLAFVAILCSLVVADADLWGHLRFGADILAARTLPRKDSYSFTSDRPWINHEWLAEVMMAGTYRAAGNAGLIGLAALAGVSTIVIVGSALGKAGVYPPLGTGLSAVAVIPAFGQLETIRPQIFSLVLFSGVLAVLNAAERGNPRLLLWLPLIVAAWANLHGGWIVGVGTVALWACAVLLRKSLPPAWGIAAPALALAGSLATPYGLELWTFLWETVGFGRAGIQDWQPMTRVPSQFVIWGLSLLVVAVSWHRRTPGTALRLIPVLVLAVLALRVVRLEASFGLAAVVLLAPTLGNYGSRRFPLAFGECVAVSVGLLLGTSFFVVSRPERIGCLPVRAAQTATDWAPEPEAVRFFTANHLKGRLLTWYDYGEYAIWHLAPAFRVSYDGRRETVYSAAVQQAHLRFYFDSRDASYARTIGADYVWVPRRLPVNHSLVLKGWIPLFRGSRSIIYGREPGTFVQHRPWAGSRCFPGP